MGWSFIGKQKEMNENATNIKYISCSSCSAVHFASSVFHSSRQARNSRKRTGRM
jgi:hypothetical protein